MSGEEGQSLLREIHEGLCGAHQAPRSIVGRAFRQGFYWPTALRDAQDLVQSCQGCQWASRQPKSPSVPLHPLPPVWPFARWGLDVIGPYPTARGSLRFAFVAIESFSRWVEAEPVAQITEGRRRLAGRRLCARRTVTHSLSTAHGRQEGGASGCSSRGG